MTSTRTIDTEDDVIYLNPCLVDAILSKISPTRVQEWWDILTYAHSVHPVLKHIENVYIIRNGSLPADMNAVSKRLCYECIKRGVKRMGIVTATLPICLSCKMKKTKYNAIPPLLIRGGVDKDILERRNQKMCQLLNFELIHVLTEKFGEHCDTWPDNHRKFVWYHLELGRVCKPLFHFMMMSHQRMLTKPGSTNVYMYHNEHDLAELFYILHTDT